MPTRPQIEDSAAFGAVFCKSGRTPQELADSFALFNCGTRLGFKSQWRKAFRWHCSLVGRVPERALNNTHFLLTVPSHRFVWAPQPQVRASDLCRDRLSAVVRGSARLPDSYNKILLQGVADYCATAVSRVDEARESHRLFLNQVRKFTSQIESLCAQFTDHFSSSFALLDLRVIEDKFDLIQAESARLGILPHLRDIPTADLVAAQDRHARIA